MLKKDAQKKCFYQIWLKECHLPLVMLIAIVLLFVLDIWVKSVVAKPGLILRNEGPHPIAVPYLLEQIEKENSFSLAWAGSSVLQGVNCTTPETTAPIVLQNMLRQNGFKATSYNLSFAGNVVADNYCLAHASMNRNADLVVFELVFGLFLGRGLGFQNAKIDFIYYIQDLPDFAHVRNKLMMTSNGLWNRNYLRLAQKRKWALLLHREVLLNYFTGRFEDPSTQIGDRLMLNAKMDVARNGHFLFKDLPTQKNEDYYWRKMTAEFIHAARKQFKEKMGRLDLSQKDPKMRLIARVCWESKIKNVPVLFYFAPLNREALVTHQSMDWEVYNRYIDTVTGILNERGCQVTNLTDAVESRHFTDSQHLNMNGHRELAGALYEPIAKIINREKPGK